MSTELARLSNLKRLIKATPLRLVLELHSKAKTECVIDYNQGFKALLCFFSPIELPYDKYPEIRKDWLVPNLYSTGLLHTLSSNLVPHIKEYDPNNCRQTPDLIRLCARAIFLIQHQELLALELAKIRIKYR